MRIIYADEAGTSAPEPVSVAAALIVNPNIHWYPVILRLRQVWDHCRISSDWTPLISFEWDHPISG
jgi:hypothetical protein